MTLTSLGITVLPEYIQSDGVAGVVRTLVDGVGVTSVTTSPYVAAPAATGTGHREPPIDGGAGKGRLLDRPLWGRREVWMTAAASFVPDPALYDGLTYRPPEVTGLTQSEGPKIGEFLTAMSGRGVETWLQIQAAIPPCHRVQFGGPAPGDACLMPNGQPVPGRVDKNASLASEDLRHYLRAFVTDLSRTYPQVSGFKFDWPEYPAYQAESLLFDFNPAAARFAAPLGLDFEAMRRGCLSFLADLSNGALKGPRIALDDFDAFRSSLVAAYPVLGDLLAFRRAIVTDYAKFLAETVAEASGGRQKTFLQCFPPPLNVGTGFDLPSVAAHCDVIGVKLYTMHWPMIEANYLGWLAGQGGLLPDQIARALSRILRLSPDTPRAAADIRYPAPDAPHPCATEDLIDKLRHARAAVPDGTKLVGITHGYGPLADVERRFDAVAEGAGGAVYVNRFGYLSDEKLKALSARIT